MSEKKRCRVLLTRHGETEASSEDMFAGDTEAPLTQAGKKQSELLSLRLKGSKLAAVYSSDLKRCLHTANLIAEQHKLQVEKVPEFREIRYGEWEHMRRSDVEKKDPVKYAQWDADPFTVKCNGSGESGLDVLSRALPKLREVVAKHMGDTILIVSHKATVRLLVAAVLGLDLRKYRDFLDQKPCALNIIDFTSEEDPPVHCHPRLSLFNDISHYSSLSHVLPQLPELSRIWDVVEKKEEQVKKELKSAGEEGEKQKKELKAAQ